MIERGKLVDADARHSIVNHIHANMVVEAAAGTGKTTCLVGRIMNMIRHGALNGTGRLAAVTFTVKAASELRERVERELARMAEAGGDDADICRAGIKALDECHIGTIHSFCARLLRERPVEAGVGPGFQEIDGDVDREFRRLAWAEFVNQMRQGRRQRLHRLFRRFELDYEILAQGFEVFTDYPDVDSWPGTEFDPESVTAESFMDGLERYRHGLAGMAVDWYSLEPGRDPILRAVQTVIKRLPRLPRPITVEDAYRLSRLFKEKAVPVQKQWAALGVSKEDMAEQVERHQRFYEDCLLPFRRGCLAARYSVVMEAYTIARQIYDDLRCRRGCLNFQDLLLRTARMVRHYPEVRADLASQYAAILVDEVQDTDPVQAELLFLLCADDHRQTDWRQCRLRPGSLFMVGDPKQSIYRFRRADIAVYQEMKRLVGDQGGAVVGLTTNFRSQPCVVDWVNATFHAGETETGGGLPAGTFPSVESPYSPAYIPLSPGRSSTQDDCFHGVRYLEMRTIGKKSGLTPTDTIAEEARRIAAFIRHGLDSGLTVPDNAGRSRPARPDDFLIVTYTKKSAGIYADAIRRAGLSCQVTGGPGLAGSASLGLLMSYLKALAEPDNAILTAAVLRGGLYGMSDPELYSWKKSGGAFLFQSDIPEGLDSPIARAMRAMARHHRLFGRMEPVAALDIIVDDLGIRVHAAAGDEPAIGLGLVAIALDQLRRYRASLSTIGALAERLEWLLQNHENDAELGDTGAVRVMNVHKTKGLEAPVVFLTSTRSQRSKPPLCAIRRSLDGVSGYLCLRGGQYGEIPLAQPVEWPKVEEDEGQYCDCERTRLHYVAATRAGCALVVSVHQSNKIWKTAYLPGYRHGKTIVSPLPEPKGAISSGCPPVQRAEIEPLVVMENISSQWDPFRIATYGTLRAKPDLPVIQRHASGQILDELTPAQAMDFGEVMHRVLSEPLSNQGLSIRIEQLVREYGLPDEILPLLRERTLSVWNSSIWRRAQEAEILFREAPFTRFTTVDGLPAWQRGVIDLVFKEDQKWVVVEYKSERLQLSGDGMSAARRHRQQVAAYADAWEELTGEPVGEIGVYLIYLGQYLQLPKHGG